MPGAFTRTSSQRHPSLAAICRQLDEVNEILAARRLERTRLELKYEFAALRFETAILRHAIACRKAGFRRDQPLWPKASGREGGRWSGRQVRKFRAMSRRLIQNRAGTISYPDNSIAMSP